MADPSGASDRAARAGGGHGLGGDALAGGVHANK